MGEKKKPAGAAKHVRASVELVDEALHITVPLPPEEQLAVALQGPQLSIRERAIAQLIREGLVHKEIGSRLNISVRTVKHHCKNLYRKYGVSDREGLLRKIGFKEKT